MPIEEVTENEQAGSVTPDGALDFMWQTFSNLNEWVRFSDTKAAAVLTVDGVIAGVLATMLGNSTSGPLYKPLPLLWVCLIVMATFYSALYALWSLLPQLKLRSERNAASSEELGSLIFFADIAKHFPTSNQFHEKIIKELENTDLAVKAISQQIWSNSKVANLKFEYVKRSLFGLAAAFGLGLFGVALFAILRLLKST